MLRLLTLVLLIAIQEAVPPALQEMVETERAFAKAATVKGVRDAFLEFFSPNAVALVPEPVSYVERLQARPAVPFSEQALLWEPRLGDVSASGDLGWLTGPSTSINHRDKQPPRHGNYLSIWRKQADGAWKVLYDVGANAPSPVPFAPGFTRFAVASRFTRREPRIAAKATLLERDAALNAQLPAKGYDGFLAPGARLHRDGMIALTDAGAIAKWIGSQRGLATILGEAEVAASGDLGYSYGLYERQEPAGRGSYLRIWTRTADGQWLLAVDAMNPAPPK